jgi:hypothetical protein
VNRALRSPGCRTAWASRMAAIASMAVLGSLFAGLSASAAIGAPCPNEATRLGPSIGLPDCRAYELITPPDTNGVPPYTDISTPYGAFETLPITVDGSSVLFGVKGGALAGSGGPGSGDLYRALRGQAGWTSELVGPSAAQTSFVYTGGISDEHSYSDLIPGGAGTLPGNTEYVGYPDGSFRLLADGSLADDPTPISHWISPGGGHMVFTSNVQLEPEAPDEVGFGPAIWIGTSFAIYPVGAVYDRTPSGLDVVSLLPGDITPPDGSSVYYRGVSHDGSTVGFNVDGTIYLRKGGESTPVITTTNPGEVAFEALSSDGHTFVYLVDPDEDGRGELFSFNLALASSTPLSAATDAQVVNISADGSHVYFHSTQALPGTGGVADANNLYVAAGGEVHFIAMLPESDEPLWRPGWIESAGIAQQNGRGPVNAPSRTTPDGQVIVFESHGSLTSFDSGGWQEIYRYDDVSRIIQCISCDQSGVAPSSDALLQGDIRSNDFTISLGRAFRIWNVTDDGNRVFFVTAESLVASDDDGLIDVYEWNAGQISLISYPHSSTKEWIYGMTPDGHDVLFTSNEGLVPQKAAGSTAIYDARVGGGFPPPFPQRAPCAEGSCQGHAVADAQEAIGSLLFQGPGNRNRCHRKHRAKGSAAGKKTRPRKTRCHRKHRRGAQRLNTNGGR